MKNSKHYDEVLFNEIKNSKGNLLIRVHLLFYILWDRVQNCGKLNQSVMLIQIKVKFNLIRTVKFIEFIT